VAIATTPSSLRATRALAIWGEPSSRRPVAPRRVRRSKAPTRCLRDLRSRRCRRGPGHVSKSAISIRATRDASMKPSFKSRSSADSPSGELGRQYQIGAGRGGLGAEPTEVSTFCANPPTTAFIWAMASRITGTDVSLPVQDRGNPGERSHAVNKTGGVARCRCHQTGWERARCAMTSVRSDFEVSGRIHLD